MKRLLTSLIVLTNIFAVSCTDNVYKADVVIYGGTSAAVSAAVQTSRMGRSVVLLSPDKHLGGLSSSGLSFSNTVRFWNFRKTELLLCGSRPSF